MDRLPDKLFAAIEAGDVAAVGRLCVCAGEDVAMLLSGRREGSGLLRRPGNGRELYVLRPTPLLLAVTLWYADVVDSLSAYKVGLDDTCTVDDITSPDHVYDGVTALHLAAIGGKLSMVETLLREGASVNSTTSLGTTALNAACFEGNCATIETLVDGGARVDAVDVHGTTCLMAAAGSENVNLLAYLVRHGADANAVDKDGRNVLFYAIRDASIDTFSYVSNPRTAACVDVRGANVLMWAAEVGRVDVTTHILGYRDALNVKIDDCDNEGRNALFYVCNNTSDAIWNILVDAGVPICGDHDGVTPLMHFASRGSLLTHHLVDQSTPSHVDVNEKDKCGRNCLYYCNDAAMLDSLLTLGACADPSSDGRTLLMHAAMNGNMEIAKHLLENASKFTTNLSGADNVGWDASMHAAASGQLDLLKLLNSYGAQRHRADDGKTVLTLAAESGNMPMLRYLMADVQAATIAADEGDNYGRNALYYSVMGGHVDAVKYLVRRGTAWSQHATDGRTILMEAIDRNHTDVLDSLLRHPPDGALDQTDSKGADVLCYVAATGRLALLKHLLAAKCRPRNDAKSRNVLMYALQNGQEKTVQCLLDKSASIGLDVNQKDASGRNVLFFSVDGGDNVPMLERLLRQGVQQRADNTGRTLLMHAAGAGHVSVVRFLLALNGDDINTKDVDGENALFYGARACERAVVELLVAAGVEAVCNGRGVCVLALCLAHGDDDLADIIVAGTADLAAAASGTDILGRSTLQITVTRRKTSLLTKLGTFYDKARDRDSEGRTLLIHACIAETAPIDIDTVRYIVENLCVDVNASDNNQRNALFHAVEWRHAAAANFLLERGSDVTCDDLGRWPLMVACGRRDVIIAEMLLQKSDKPSMLVKFVDHQGRTAVHFSAMADSCRTVWLLKSYSANVNVRDKRGQTPAMYACAAGHAAVLATLIDCGAVTSFLDADGANALLHCFAKSPNLKCVKLAIGSPGDVEQSNTRRVTPLMLACRRIARKQTDIVRYLLDNGADPIIQDDEGRDSFDYCLPRCDHVIALLEMKSQISNIEKQALLKYHNRIAAVVDVSATVKAMLAERVFSTTVAQEMTQTAPSERVRRMLDIIQKRGNRAFRTLCEALKRNHPELAYVLLKETYRKDEEIFW